MLSLEEAVRRILDHVTPLGSETVPLRESFQRYAASPVTAPIQLPPFDNAAMDGYAVLAADLVTATPEDPISLLCVDDLPAGRGAGASVEPGKCVRVFTGAPLPTGADAVVMQEETRLSTRCEGHVEFLASPKPWQNVRFAGEDIRRSSLLIAPGERLRVGHLATAAACGVSHLEVGRKPVVGLLATGDELVEPGSKLLPGQIYESNRVQLATLIDSVGGVVRIYPIVPDTFVGTCDSLDRAARECDVVITSGAVSVGDHDHVKPAIEKLGGALDFWRVAIRPGKPFVHAVIGETPLFGLPGNPVSALVTYLVLVRPALIALQGGTDHGLSCRPGTLTEPVANHGSRRHFARVSINDRGEVAPVGLQASHGMSSLKDADGLLDVPPNTVLEAGCVVRVQLISD